MSDSVIKVENVSKAYRLGQIGGGTLKEDVSRWWARLRGQADPTLKIGEERKTEVRRRKSDVSGQTSDLRSPHSDIFWALDNVSFEVRQGEVLGIIGRNGAGKSTLLKILSQVTTPTSGQIKIKGRIASLLEVGTGFNPEMTGRENVFLNGAILGMTKAEIRSKFDEIVAFSEIEEFIDTPVKRYSSGMYVRLAFAVAAHLEPEILICDEVLAVGDTEFQKKCIGKMKDASRGGRTVLFVSHNMAAITRLCQKALLLDRGLIVARGTADSVVNEYHHTGKEDQATYIPDPSKKLPGNDIVTLSSVSVVGTDGGKGPNFGSGTGIDIEIAYQIHKLVRGFRLGINLLDPDGAVIFNAKDTDTDDGEILARVSHPGLFVSCCHIPAGFLNHGQYSLTVGSDTPGSISFYCENIVTFFIVPGGATPARGDGRPGLICPNLKWEIVNQS